jgi:hypothetical protein
VAATISEREAMVELQPMPGRAAAAFRVDVAASVSVSL